MLRGREVARRGGDAVHGGPGAGVVAGGPEVGDFVAHLLVLELDWIGSVVERTHFGEVGVTVWWLIVDG